MRNWAFYLPFCYTLFIRFSKVSQFISWVAIYIIPTLLVFLSFYEKGMFSFLLCYFLSVMLVYNYYRILFLILYVPLFYYYFYIKCTIMYAIDLLCFFIFYWLLYVIGQLYYISLFLYLLCVICCFYVLC